MTIRSNQPVESTDYLISVIPQNRLAHLALECRDSLRRLPGHVLEVGVYRGGTLLQLAKAVRECCPDKKVIGLTSGAGGIITLVVEDNQLSQNEQNTDFSTNSTDFIDFTENNPFGDTENN